MLANCFCCDVSVFSCDSCWLDAAELFVIGVYLKVLRVPLDFVVSCC